VGIRAVLFDVGGPLDTEIEHERRIDLDIRAALAAEGSAADDVRYREAERWAVDSFASSTYQAMIWYLTGFDAARAARVYQGFRQRAHGRDVFELRPGMAELLERLHGRGLKLGLAANQPTAVIERLDRGGVGRFFHHREVSEHHGFLKPDVRLFLRACDDLGVQPAECIMVGDRIDNDIVPARLLGMRTVLLRVGRHSNQQPRTWHERPDAEVYTVPELEAALDRLLGDSPEQSGPPSPSHGYPPLA
jgi:HAD superfamily hydrolase (TIGR01549 family)